MTEIEYYRESYSDCCKKCTRDRKTSCYEGSIDTEISENYSLIKPHKYRDRNIDKHVHKHHRHHHKDDIIVEELHEIMINDTLPQNIRYIIISDIDDTLYTNKSMTDKIDHAHGLINSLDDKHLVFLSARPDLSIIRLYTRWKLHKDFDRFTLLLGSVTRMFLYFMFKFIYLASFKRFSRSSLLAKRIVGHMKIDVLKDYINNRHKHIFSPDHLNCIIFMGDNLQGDEYVGRYILASINDYIVRNNAKYSTSCITFIRDADKQKKSKKVRKNKHNIPVDDDLGFELCKNIVENKDVENMFFIKNRCDVSEIIDVVSRLVCKRNKN